MLGVYLHFIVHWDVTNQVCDAWPVQCQTCSYSPFYPAAEHHRPLTRTKLYCMTETNVKTDLFSDIGNTGVWFPNHNNIVQLQLHIYTKNKTSCCLTITSIYLLRIKLDSNHHWYKFTVQWQSNAPPVDQRHCYITIFLFFCCIECQQLDCSTFMTLRKQIVTSICRQQWTRHTQRTYIQQAGCWLMLFSKLEVGLLHIMHYINLRLTYLLTKLQI